MSNSNLWMNDSNHINEDGTIAGDLDMDNYNIVNLSPPVDGGDAANKNYVDTSLMNFLKIDGTNSMNANLNAVTHKNANVVDPTAGSDAANKKLS
jgi:hypothetical protein